MSTKYDPFDPNNLPSEYRYACAQRHLKAAEAGINPVLAEKVYRRQLQQNQYNFYKSATMSYESSPTSYTTSQSINKTNYSPQINSFGDTIFTRLIV